MNSLRTRLFHSYARIRRPMTLGVRAAVENEAGEVAFVRHTYMKGWYMPGGGIERAEPAIEALKRELVEEVGVKVTGEAEVFGMYSNHQSFRNDHVILYRVPYGAWEPCKATSRGEIAEIRWCDPLMPPEGTTPGNLARLGEIYGGAMVSPYWAGSTK